MTLVSVYPTNTSERLSSVQEDDQCPEQCKKSANSSHSSVMQRCAILAATLAFLGLLYLGIACHVEHHYSAHGLFTETLTEHFVIVQQNVKTALTKNVTVLDEPAGSVDDVSFERAVLALPDATAYTLSNKKNFDRFFDNKEVRSFGR